MGANARGRQRREKRIRDSGIDERRRMDPPPVGKNAPGHRQRRPLPRNARERRCVLRTIVREHRRRNHQRQRREEGPTPVHQVSLAGSLAGRHTAATCTLRSCRRSAIWARSRARIDECIWLTRLSDKSSVEPISFIVISSK